MGIQAKPMGKMRSHFQKMDNEAFNEKKKAVKENKADKKSKKSDK